jgi:hypothetical protein
MEQIIEELIRRHGLEEDLEHVIIPFLDKDGRKKRCFLLKRRFLRLVYPDGHNEDFPLEEVIEAIVRFPGLPVSDALSRLHKELEAEILKIFENEKEVKSE